MSTRKKTAIVFMVLAGFTAIVITLALYRFSADSQAMLNAEMAKAKAEGFWVDNVKELAPVAHGPNAADTYLAIHHDANIGYPVIDDLSDPMGLAMDLVYLNLKESDLAKAEQASKIQDCVFSHDYGSPTELFPEFAGLKEFVKGFCLRARIHAADGHPELVTGDLLAAARIARQSGQEPILISQLVQIACDVITITTIEKIATAAPQLATELPQVLDALGPIPDIRTSIKAESTSTRKMLTQPLSKEWFGDAGHQLSPDEQRIVIMSKFYPVRQRYQAGAIRFSRQLLEAVSASKTPAQMVHACKAEENKLNTSKDLEYDGVKLVGVFYYPAARAMARDASYRRITRQALAMIASHTYDRLPLKGEYAIDPLDDQPLNLKPIPGGFRVYGLGDSDKLHGGIHRGRDVSGDKADLCFDYPYLP